MMFEILYTLHVFLIVALTSPIFRPTTRKFLEITHFAPIKGKSSMLQ